MESVLNVKDISKSFPGVKALDNVNIDFRSSEVHALVGMNGSGKSTLLKIITGVLKPDSGQIFINGKAEEIHSVSDSRKQGISLVYQELSLVPCLTVAENIFLGHLPRNGIKVSISEAKKKSEKLLKELGMNINPSVHVEDLIVAEKQMVEIAKALSVNTKLLLLDEPSAVLTLVELKGLFKLIRSLKQNGVTVVYISHRLEEVFEIADRVTVLRDGVVIDTKNVKDLKSPDLIKMMIGRTLNDLFPELQATSSKKKVLEIKNLSTNKIFGIDIDVYEKEIVGIYGVVGAGQKELTEAIFGINTENLTYNEYKIDGTPVNIKSPHEAIMKGLAYIPEERKEDGLMLSLSIRENMVITFLEKIKKKFGLINRSVENEKTAELIKRLKVKTPSPEIVASNLSGGNQQKIVIAKWLGKDSNIFICFEPTRGIDVEAKAQVYAALEDVRRLGASVIIVSSELSEIIGMSERVYIMSKGKMVGELNKDDMDHETILLKATGLEV